ncbi:hypothetical protein ACGF5M_02985 [Gemmatimonadota bacterium]
MAGSRKAFALDFTERPYIGTGAWPGLMGWMLDTRPSQSAIFLNLSGDKILLDVSGLLNAPRFTFEQISLSEPRLRVSREEVLNHFTGYGTHDLTLNPYSLTWVQ